uniref:Uncharacterized protein n=1 Tax=Knipowitschia caucasica TaxID=637954 RepID=A0AAV2KFD8_KNICA
MAMLSWGAPAESPHRCSPCQLWVHLKLGPAVRATHPAKSVANNNNAMAEQNTPPLSHCSFYLPSLLSRPLRKLKSSVYLCFLPIRISMKYVPPTRHIPGSPKIP